MQEEVKDVTKASENEGSGLMDEATFIPSSFSISLHSILSTAQQRSMVDSDYAQYHAYLTNRISRLRHSRPVYKRKSGKKHVYQSRDFTSLKEANVHENYVLLAIYLVERAWAHAMELKVLNESNTLRKKCNFIKRMKKAVGYVADLERMKEICDDRTKIEIDCYSAWIKASYATEVKDWVVSCEQYAMATNLCYLLSNLYKSDQDLLSSDLFYSRAVNILQPLLTYSQYELQQEGISSISEINHIASISDLSIIDEDKHVEVEDLDRQVNKLIVTFRGNQISLTNGLRIAFIKIENKERDFRKMLAESGVKTSVKDLKFMELLNSYDEVIDTTRKSAQQYEGIVKGPAVDRKRFECDVLLGYFKFQKLKLIMNRNEEMIKDLKVYDVDGRKSSVNTSHQKDAEAMDKHVEEIAYLYDALLQNAKAVVSLPGLDLEKNHDGDDEFSLEAKANVLRIRAFRCYYVAQMYASDCISKYAEALALFDKALQLSIDASEEISACEDMENAGCLLNSLSELEQSIKGLKVRTLASLYLETRSSGASSMTSGLSLLSRLDDFDSGGKTYKIADVPMQLQPIACKPVFFDIANNFLCDFPKDELQNFVRSSKLKPQGNGSIFRWFN